jgi:uncharacterized membrane protein YfcA
VNPTAIFAVAVAGFLAGAINAVVGSGSLITFPVLLAVGFPPVTANVSNALGLAFGNVSAVVGYRRELRSQLRRLAWLALPALAGAGLGAALLLVLPQRVFATVVPVLILLAVVLVIIQPRLSRFVASHEAGAWGRLVLPIAVFCTAIYGGYFGAAQGVILMSLLAVLLSDPLQNLNALKNGIVMLVNGLAAAIFLFSGHVALEPAAILAVSSVAGGQVGASLGRRTSPTVLRALIVVAGLATVVKLLA